MADTRWNVGSRIGDIANSRSIAAKIRLNENPTRVIPVRRAVRFPVPTLNDSRGIRTYVRVDNSTLLAQPVSLFATSV